MRERDVGKEKHTFRLLCTTAYDDSWLCVTGGTCFTIWR